MLIVPSLLGAVCACEGRARTTAGASGRSEPRSGPPIAILDLSDGLPEHPPAGVLGLPSKKPPFDALVRAIEELGRSKDVRGVLVRLGDARIGLAKATEVGALLDELGRRVPVYCHADDMSNGTLYLASRGCKRTWLSPSGTVDAIGLAMQLIYFHKLLADELGLDVDFLQIGKYKGAEEPFTRDGPSPEARESVSSTLAGLRAAWLDGILHARPDLAPDTPEDGPYDAPDAKARRIVDAIGYFDEAREALEKDAGAVRAEVRFGAGSSGEQGDDLTDVLRMLTGESLEAAPVALVRADGAISMDGGGVLGSEDGIVEQRLVRILRRLERDDDVKAVVLRIDSPGGSALASDLLWHALMRIRERKPLIVSVGGMAASGGYYLASTGAVVFAEPTSILGSIGVVGGKIAADHALERIGVHAETIAAKPDDPHAVARAAYDSLLVPWDDATRARLEQTMTGVYDLFLARVAEGRNLSVQQVSEAAEGRLFSGSDALARRLVDEIGGLRDALAKARAMAGLRPDAPFAVATEGSGLLDVLTGGEPPLRSRAPAAASPAALLGALAPDLQPFVASVAPLAERERTLFALPFALTVR